MRCTGRSLGVDAPDTESRHRYGGARNAKTPRHGRLGADLWCAAMTRLVIAAAMRAWSSFLARAVRPRSPRGPGRWTARWSPRIATAPTRTPPGSTAASTSRRRAGAPVVGRGGAGRFASRAPRVPPGSTVAMRSDDGRFDMSYLHLGGSRSVSRATMSRPGRPSAPSGHERPPIGRRAAPALRRARRRAAATPTATRSHFLGRPRAQPAERRRAGRAAAPGAGARPAPPRPRAASRRPAPSRVGAGPGTARRRWRPAARRPRAALGASGRFCARGQRRAGRALRGPARRPPEHAPGRAGRPRASGLAPRRARSPGAGALGPAPGLGGPAAGRAPAAAAGGLDIGWVLALVGVTWPAPRCFARPRSVPCCAAGPGRPMAFGERRGDGPEALAPVWRRP